MPGTLILASYTRPSLSARIMSEYALVTSPVARPRLFVPPTGQVWRSYYYAGGQRIAMRVEGAPSNNGVFYLLTDHLGSTSVTADATGNPVSVLRYYPYGQTRYSSGVTPTTYRYTGQRSDESSTGLYFYGARYYDALIGRFISADTMVPGVANPQALNRFSYVSNNPLKYVDPSGHCWGALSFVRGLPSYGTTCNNLDMALTIVQHPEASAWDKTVAGAYIVGEGLAHATAIVYGGIAACGAASAACYKAVEGGLLCAVTNCTGNAQTAANTISALQQNFGRGLQLAEAGQIPDELRFFQQGLSDAPVPSEVPTAGIQEILGNLGNIYAVGKPAIGADLDLIVVGEQTPQLATEQLQAINSLAQQAGYSNAHVQVMNYIQAAAFRFATQPTSPLHAVPNLRNPMLWRLIGGE